MKIETPASPTLKPHQSIQSHQNQRKYAENTLKFNANLMKMKELRWNLRKLSQYLRNLLSCINIDENNMRINEIRWNSSIITMQTQRVRKGSPDEGTGTIGGNREGVGMTSKNNLIFRITDLKSYWGCITLQMMCMACARDVVAWSATWGDQNNMPDRFGYKASSFHLTRHVKTFIFMVWGILKRCNWASNL